MFVSEQIGNKVILEVHKKFQEYPWELISQIHDFQWREIYKGTSTVSSIEMPGLGRIKIQDKMLENHTRNVDHRIKKYTKRYNQSPREGIERRVKFFEQELEYLKSKK